MTTSAETPSGAAAHTRVHALFDALNAHDLDRVAALHADDVVLTDPTRPVPARGRDAVRDHFAGLWHTFPDLEFATAAMEIYVADSGRVATTWQASATMTGPLEPPGYAPTGKHAELSGVCLYEFSDGLLARHTIVYDVLGLLVQLGLMPRTESRSVKATAWLQRTSTHVGAAMHRHH